MRRVLLFIAVSCVVAFADSHAAVIEVDCKGPGFNTIQEGVDAAADGDTILIAPCVYEEQVAVQDKNLVFQGSGADVTELLWDGSGWAIGMSCLDWGKKAVRDLRITSDKGVAWAEHTMIFENCRITGRCVGGSDYGGAVVDNSAMAALSIYCSGLRDVAVTDSRIGALQLNSWWYGSQLFLNSSGSRYGEIEMWGDSATCRGDSIGRISLWEGWLYAEDSTVDSVEASLSSQIVMESCTIGELVTEWDGDVSYFPPLSLSLCLVTGSVLAELEWGSDSHEPGGAAGSRGYNGGVLLEHNTILGDLTYEHDVPSSVPYWVEHQIRSNIVAGETELYGGEMMVISHNDFVGGLVVTDPGDSVYANISEPPLLCYPAGGDYRLQDCSPCVGAAHDGGDIGAFGVGCQCEVPVEQTSWGAIKAMFR